MDLPHHCESSEAETSGSEFSEDSIDKEDNSQDAACNRIRKLGYDNKNAVSIDKSEQSDELETVVSSSCESIEETDETCNDYSEFMLALKKNLPKLKVLFKANRCKKLAILNNANRELIECMSECAKYILQGHIKLTDVQFRRLQKHKEALRKVSNPQKNWISKKAGFIHHNGFLHPLLNAVFATLN